MVCCGCRDFPDRADSPVAVGFKRISVGLGHERLAMTKRCAVPLEGDRWFANSGDFLSVLAAMLGSSRGAVFARQLGRPGSAASTRQEASAWHPT
jgi:hypothetical protein